MTRLVAVLLLLALSFDALAGGCPAAPAPIEKAIHRHIAMLRATEYCAARRVKTERGITVAIYTAEGACAALDLRLKPGSCSNDWARYMVALSGQRVTAPVEIGGKGGFTDTDVKISDGVVEVKGVSVGPHDPICCPSVQETKQYKVSPSRLSVTRP